MASQIITGGIKKSELPLIAAKFNIGDRIKKFTIDGNPVLGKIIQKTSRFCVVETIGKKECFLWQDLAGKAPV